MQSNTESKAYPLFASPSPLLPPIIFYFRQTSSHFFQLSKAVGAVENRSVVPKIFEFFAPPSRLTDRRTHFKGSVTQYERLY